MPDEDCHEKSLGFVLAELDCRGNEPLVAHRAEGGFKEMFN